MVRAGTLPILYDRYTTWCNVYSHLQRYERPSYISDSHCSWLLHDALHRHTGPAIIHFNGKLSHFRYGQITGGIKS